MAPTSPLNPIHQQAEASFLTYGSAAAAPSDPPSRAAQVVETFGELEGEYAALRKGCVLIDMPQRGLLRITGGDHLDFLNRMVTQELKGMRPYQSRHAFWLSRKGRIDADLRLIELPDEMLVGVDVLAAAGAARSLADFLFSEDVQIADATESMHVLALHGPTSLRLVQSIASHHEGPPLSDMSTGQCCRIEIGGHRVAIDRDDVTGEIGLTISMAAEAVTGVYQQLLERGLDENGNGSSRSTELFRLRPAGWHAFNIARIEAGTPIFNVDFGANSLPAETGLLDERVSFTKGCYLGQEVVARMKSLGHPKQVLVGLRVMPGASGVPASGRETQPISGASVFRADDEALTPVGAVTSSTRSPMLGDAIICFAQVRWEHREPGTKLLVDTDAGRLPAEVQRSLVFWGRER